MARSGAITDAAGKDLQAVIRELPDCIAGDSDTERFLLGIASKIRQSAEGSDSWLDRLTDFGEGSTIYSKDRAIAAADALENYGKGLASRGGQYCRATFERNQVIRLLGDAYGLVGARVAVNETLAEARQELKTDLVKSGTNWLMVIGLSLAGLAVIWVITSVKSR